MDTDYLEDDKLEIYAREMGITVEELEELDYREDETSTNDGTTTSFYIEFADENPWKIMVKIKGLQDNTVYFQPGIFETDDGDPDL